MGEYKTLSLSQLKVNPQNPRYRNPRIGESDAILALFKEIKSKPATSLRHMLNLIDDIVTYGSNPAALPIVVPDPDESTVYQVMEGNRRIASLKLLYFPKLAATVFQSEPHALKRLNELRGDFLARFHDRYKKVLCVVYSTPEETLHWIALRHTGENEGRGITPWDKAAKDRVRLQAAERKHTVATQVVDVLIKEGYLEPGVPVVLSTVERMIKDPDVAARLHVGIENGEVEFPTDSSKRDFALKILQRIALDTVEKDVKTKRKRLTSRHINQKPERLKYFERIITQVSSPDKGAPPLDKKSSPVEGKDATSSSVPAESGQVHPSPVTPASIPSAVSSLPSRPPATRDYKKRLGVAAKGIKVRHSPLNHLYQELCKLDANYYPNVGIMGIRAFLEGSLDVFIQRFADESEFQSWKKAPSAPFQIPLSQKTARVTDYLERQDALPAGVAQAIRKYQSDKDNLLSIDTLQAYLHNPDLVPRGDTVKYWWDAYHPFFEALWHTYNTVKR